MAKFLEDKRREQAVERAREGVERVRGEVEDAAGGFRASPEVDEPRPVFHRIVRAIPEELRPDGLERRSARRDQARQAVSESVSQMASLDVGVGLEGLQDVLRELVDIELDNLGDTELLRVIAEANRTQALYQNSMFETMITQSVVLDEIATAVEAAATVSVSGTNDTGRRAGVPVTVVPRADEETIPVRRLWIRADPDNTHGIYFGDDDVSPNDGFLLRPGETHAIDLDFRDDILWMASDEPRQEVHLLGLV